MKRHLFISLWPALMKPKGLLLLAFAKKTPAQRRFDQQLKLQAYLDGEWSERAARHMAETRATAPEAQAVLTELCAVKSSLAGNESGRPVPQGRELYWSAIERAITLAKPPKTEESLPFPEWAWRLSPICGAVLGLLVVLLSHHHFRQNPVSKDLAV
jgi:hypothetical protein